MKSISIASIDFLRYRAGNCQSSMVADEIWYCFWGEDKEHKVKWLLRTAGHLTLTVCAGWPLAVACAACPLAEASSRCRRNLINGTRLAAVCRTIVAQTIFKFWLDCTDSFEMRAPYRVLFTVCYYFGFWLMNVDYYINTALFCQQRNVNGIVAACEMVSRNRNAL